MIKYVLACVVHMVVDWVQSRLVGAAVSVGRAELVQVIPLSGRIIDVIIRASATTFKGVKEAIPVTAFVRQDFALAVEVIALANKSRRANDDAILDEVSVIFGDILGQGAVASRPILHKVNIKRAVVAFAKSLLHFVVVLKGVVRLPLGVDGPVDIFDVPVESRVLVSFVHDVDDFGELVLLHTGVAG